MTKPHSISLIIISLALLAVFEGLWLHRLWQEEYGSLQQQTDYWFQQSVLSLQDTIAYQSFRENQLAPDSFPIKKQTLEFKAKRNQPLPDTFFQSFQTERRSNITLKMQVDSGNNTHADTSSELRVFVMRSAPGDSNAIKRLNRVLHGLPKQLQLPPDGHQIFNVELQTIPITQLYRNYQQQLQTAGISLPFDILLKDSLPFQLPPGALATQPAWAGFMSPQVYTAVFPQYQGYLFRQLLPALGFALILFGITATAFILIYRSLRQQQRLTRLKNEFISNITHELKTPITTVGVALEALSDFDVLNQPEKTQEYLAHSKLELDRLSLLIEKVLRISMFEESVPSLKLENIAFPELLQEVLAAMHLQIERAGALVHIDLPNTPVSVIAADRQHLSSVIFNLLDNALKYSSPDPQIWISIKQSDGFLQFAVRDNGIGIPKEYQSKVFDKFFRMPANNRHDIKGHGLGLNYTAQVVRQHGGKISVASSPETGTVFTVELPVSPAAA